MKARQMLFPILAGALLLLGSCASLQRSRDEGNVARIAGLINQGRAQELTRMSAVPFLLDQEIVVLAKDVEHFWSTIAQVGFRVDEPLLEVGEKVGPESYRRFYDSFEVRTYFKKYLRKSTRLLTLKTSTGQHLLLLVSDGIGGRVLHGFKGPY